VTLDGKDVPSAVLGVERRVNPGEHVVTATRDGKEIFRQKVTLQEGQLFDVDIDVSAPAPATPTSTVSVPTPPPVTPPPTAPSKVPAVIALTAGGVLVVGGVVAYVLARGARDDYFAGCATQVSATCDDSAGKSKVRLYEGLAFTGWGLGAVGLTVGTILLTRSSSPTTGQLVVAPTVGGMAVQFGGKF